MSSNLRAMLRQKEMNRFIIKQENDGWPLMKKKDALAERVPLETELKAISVEDTDMPEKTVEMDAIQHACHARFWFRGGDVGQKRAILQKLGSNLSLKDKILNLCATYPLPEMEKFLERAPRKKAGSKL